MEVSKEHYYVLSVVSLFTVVVIFSEGSGVFWTQFAEESDFGNQMDDGVDSITLTESNDNASQTDRHGQGTVPMYVHLIWFYPPGSNFRFHHLMCLMSIKLHIKPQRIILWYSHQPRGPWWAFAKKAVSEIALVQYPAPTEVFNQSVNIVEHQSDVARLDILIKYGGIYFDLDVVALRDFEPLLRYPVTLGAETPHLLGSGVILAQPNATFLHLWKDKYRNYEPTKWNYNSVVVPMELAKRHAAIVHIEWFTIHRPNWFERDWLYAEGKLWDWSENFAVHLWYRTHDGDYDPITIRTLNTTVGEIFRFIYYGSPQLFKT